MRSLIFTHIQNAQQSLSSNRLRSALTVLGVVIGVGSMTAILALGVGASSIVGQQVDALGGNIAVVRPVNTVSDPIAHLSQLQSSTSLTASTLTMHDVDSLTGISDVSAVAPLATLGGSIVGDSVAPGNDTVLATTPALAQVSSLKLQQGQFLDADISPTTAVIGPQLSVDIFGTEESIGRSLTIRGHQFTVIGVLARSNQPISYNVVNFDDVAFINFSSTSLVGVDEAQIQQIDIQSKSVSNLHSVVASANQLLLTNHLQQADFQILTGDQIAQPTSQVFLIIAGVTTAIAAISLLVGGIGIMNIMLVSVAERTREIGLRKALGARRSDIVWQFLIESIILSLSGGIIGYAVGYATAFAISTFLTFDPVLNWQIAAIAIGLSLVVGVVFGIYPAIRASHKDPIRALRQYD